MKTIAIMLALIAIPLFGSTQSQHEEPGLNNTRVRVCQGHKGYSGIYGREHFAMAKSIKDAWEEEIPYDRSVKSTSCEMYFDPDANKWCLEKYLEHVDNAKQCDNYIVKSITEDPKPIAEPQE